MSRYETDGVEMSECSRTHLAAELVAGALDEDEALEYARHARDCEACRRAVAGAALADAVLSVHAPELSGVQGQPRPSRGYGLSARLLLAAVVVLVAVALGAILVGGLAPDERVRGTEANPAHQSSFTVVVVDSPSWDDLVANDGAALPLTCADHYRQEIAGRLVTRLGKLGLDVDDCTSLVEASFCPVRAERRTTRMAVEHTFVPGAARTKVRFDPDPSDWIPDLPEMVEEAVFYSGCPAEL